MGDRTRCRQQQQQQGNATVGGGKELTTNDPTRRFVRLEALPLRREERRVPLLRMDLKRRRDALRDPSHHENSSSSSRKNRKVDCAESVDPDADRRMSWSSIPTSDQLRTMGIHDRVRSVTDDVERWSLFGLKTWRKPLKQDFVKKQQSKIRRMLLKSSSPPQKTPAHPTPSPRRRREEIDGHRATENRSTRY